MSKEEINPDKLDVLIDIFTPYRYSVQKCEEKNEDRVGEVYHYRITINFEAIETEGEEELSYVTILYNGQQFAKNIDHIRFDYDTKEPFIEKGFATKTKSSVGIRISPNNKGAMKFCGGSFQAKRDIELQKVYLYESDCRLTSCVFNITTPQKPYSQKWKAGELIRIPIGSELSVDLSIENPEFSRRLFCGMNQYLVLEYKQSGKVYQTYLELTFATQPSADEALCADT